MCVMHKNALTRVLFSKEVSCLDKERDDYAYLQLCLTIMFSNPDSYGEMLTLLEITI